MVHESPPVITDKEMIRNLKELEKSLPRDSLYEGLEEGKTFKAKKTKKPGLSFFINNETANLLYIGHLLF